MKKSKSFACALLTAFTLTLTSHMMASTVTVSTWSPICQTIYYATGTMDGPDSSVALPGIIPEKRRFSGVV